MDPASQENNAIKATDVDTRWPYRAGYPRLCPPPVGTQFISWLDPVIAGVDREIFLSRVGEVLVENSVSVRAPTWADFSHPVHVGYRALFQPTLADLRLLIECTYKKGVSESVKWAEAVPRLLQVVQELAVPVMGIELVDLEYMNTCRICEPPSGSEDFVPEWENEGGYREKVLKIFEDYPPMFRVMVPTGLRAIGREAYDHTTVISFEAIDANDDRWDETHRQLRSILPERIGIEIRQGAGSLLLHNFWSNFFLHDQLAVREAGCRIGLQTAHDGEDKVSGTMGGYVKTRPKGENEAAVETIYGVTNGHVLLEIANKEHNQVTMTTQDMLSEHAVDIQSPPESDRREREANLAEKVAKSQQRKAELQETCEAELERDPELSQSPRNEICFPKDTVYDDELQGRINADTWGVEGLGKQIKVVAKLGQVGPRSWGLVNSFKADFNLPYIVNNEKKNHIVSGWAVSSPWPWSKDNGSPVLNSKKPIQHFAERGESGSFVVSSPNWHIPDQKLKGISSMPWKRDPDVFIVGLLWGGHEVNSDLGYFVPFDAVKREIEDLTGEEMVWPRKR